VVVDGPPDAVSTVARQAGLFASPTPGVWGIDGTTVVPAVSAPAPRQPDAPAPPELVDLLIDAGLEIVAEGGLVRGEINGLEVARVVHGITTAGIPIDRPQLEVGVGKADRELTAMVHGELGPVDQLSRVVEIVREHRRPDAPRHPLNQLVPDRWLRAVLCRNPGIVGLASLRPAAGVRPRPNLTERDIAIAAGTAADVEGHAVVVACSVGIALDLVPAAADAARRSTPRRACCWRYPSVTTITAPAGSRPTSACPRRSFPSPVTGGRLDSRPPPARGGTGVATLARRARTPL
jgi:hypothetical protein